MYPDARSIKHKICKELRGDRTDVYFYLLNLPHYVWLAYYITFVKLHNWNYSGDRGPRGLFQWVWESLSWLHFDKNVEFWRDCIFRQWNSDTVAYIASFVIGNKISMSCMEQYPRLDHYICCKQDSFKILKTELLQIDTQTETKSSKLAGTSPIHWFFLLSFEGQETG